MYCDSAIIVKLLTPEPDSEVFEQQLQASVICTSELAWGEVYSALLAKERHSLLHVDERVAAWAQFEEWVADGTVRLEPVESRLLRRLPVLLARCHPSVPVRTLDAIHVATCEGSGDFPLAATDRRLRAAANHLKIPLFPDRLSNDLF